ncbi:MAG: ABC transporter substrate-binding protein [Acetobacteraceae bacterium]|nr:ABC transporter substrate-binding protein [Acetobacteraceae bacterium]
MRSSTASSITRRSAMLVGATSVLAPRGRVWSAEAIVIGQIAPLSGGGAASGPSHVNGARLAADKINAAGGVLGKRLELVVEDGLSTPAGAMAAFSRLRRRGDVSAILGATRSVEMHAINPEALNANRPVLFGATDPVLTQLGNPWFFRCQPSDLYSARAMAEFGVDTLGKRNWAILRSSDPFGTSGGALLRAALDKLDARVALELTYTNQQGDFPALARAVARSDADLLASYVSFEPDQVAIARAVHAAGLRLPWIGSQFITARAVLAQVGDILSGTYGMAAFHPDANPEAQAFARDYEQAFGAQPDFFAAWPFDAVTILAHALATAGTTEPGPVRRAILATSGLRGAEGEFNFNAKGDGLHGYNLVRNEDGRIVFLRRFNFGGQSNRG